MELMESGYGRLLEQISGAYSQGQARAAQAVNSALIDTYWQVGRHIVEFEQGGEQRAGYGKALLEHLASDLSLRHGKGFSRSNLIRIRQFYRTDPKGATLSHQFSWSHILAERYAMPLPQRMDEAAALSARVEEHPKRMGAVWK